MSDFTVILFAGGTNRLSSDFSIPKSLLPIGNRPLIWYTLQILQSDPTLSSSPLLVLTSNSSRQSVDDYLSTLKIANYEIVLYRSSSETTTNDDQQINSDQLGTLDILRSCYSKIRTESVCLITSDLFGQISLTPMIDLFRVRDASLLMLLLPTSNNKEAIPQPGQKAKFIQDPEYYTLDPSTDSITSIRYRADLEEHLPLRKNILIKYPRTQIRNDLVDAHLYLIKKSSLDIAIRSKYSSFRKEFLPKMIRQYASGQPLENLLSSSSSSNQKLVQRQKTVDYDDYADLSRILQIYQSDEKNISNGCYYTIAETQLYRVKHVIAYLEANRQASTLISSYTNEDITYKERVEQLQISSDCVIGDGCEFGKKTTIKRTIIGKNSRIEEKCKIVNCVLLDNVTVKEGSTIQNSILCSRSIVGTKCDIVNSIVCANQQVDGNKKITSETISAQNDDDQETFLYDDDDPHD